LKFGIVSQAKGLMAKAIALGEQGVSAARGLVSFVIAGYIGLIVVFALNTASFDATTLALWGIVGVVIVAAILRGISGD
jgi:hypothetical protein|tara:strand:+ start:5089 stop:5325 length:237 start_codon:yes stop_codon:yes gene_type:complete